MRKLLTIALLAPLLAAGQDIFVRPPRWTPTSLESVPEPLFALNSDADSSDYTGSEGSGACTPSNVTWPDTGGGNYAAEFTGTSGALTCGNGLSNLPEFTVTGWFDHDSWGQNSAGRMFVKINPSTNPDWEILVNDTGDRVQLAMSSTSGSNNYNAPDNSAALNGWRSFAVVVSNCANLADCLVQIYVDGSAVTTTKVGTATAARNDSSGYDVRVGNGYNGDRTFDGKIDDIRVYGVALSAGQVALIDAGGRL